MSLLRRSLSVTPPGQDAAEYSPQERSALLAIAHDSIAASEGFTIEASDLGKSKMVVQIVSVVAAILDHRWLEWIIGRYFFPIHILARVGIWFMVTLSLVSAADYFAAFWSKIDRQVVRRQRRAFILSRRRKRDVAPTT